MATYGELIDSNVDFGKLPVYTFFLEYFNNPLLRFFKQTPDHHVIYGAKVRSQLSRQKRYLFILLIFQILVNYPHAIVIYVYTHLHTHTCTSTHICMCAHFHNTCTLTQYIPYIYICVCVYLYMC